MGMLWLVEFFFFKQKTAYEMRISDWSSDVCSSDLAGLQVLAGKHGGRARVAIVELAADRVDDIAEQDELRKVAEGIHDRGAEIGPQDHVGLVDGLPAGDRGAVEQDAFDQRVLIDRIEMHRQAIGSAHV